MNITHQASPKKASITYEVVKPGSLFRFVDNNPIDVGYRTINGHIWLSSSCGVHFNTNENTFYFHSEVILLDHELIIKGEL